jgi:hypothetical protein
MILVNDKGKLRPVLEKFVADVGKWSPADRQAVRQDLLRAFGHSRTPKVKRPPTTL